MRIFLMGGTGLVGSRLIPRLLERNDQVVLLTRRPDTARQKWGACTVIEGDPMQAGPWMNEVEGCEAVINLVGEGVFNRRWRAKFKQLLRDSRIKSTEHVVQALTKSPRTAAGAAKVLVNASAIGYYGPHGDEELDENSPPGNDFLAQACVDWEKAARAAEGHGVRVALVRVGVVLDGAGGALKQMMRPFRFFMGGPVGNGRQYVSWVHHQDLVGILLLALDSPGGAGPINGTAPNPVTNKQLAKALGRAMGRPSFMPAPKFMLRLVLGGVATLVTTGQRVLPRKAQELGYTFKFPEIDGALKDILG
ncbi:MAG: TIGR01777 family oxidoreductase [Gemmataceae bacterium]|nr:TIGR01777 family oxidoreductase [Gemmataceae bacterium]